MLVFYTIVSQVFVYPVAMMNNLSNKLHDLQVSGGRFNHIFIVTLLMTQNSRRAYCILYTVYNRIEDNRILSAIELTRLSTERVR